jgi:hypothetical protein
MIFILDNVLVHLISSDCERRCQKMLPLNWNSDLVASPEPQMLAILGHHQPRQKNDEPTITLSIR